MRYFIDISYNGANYHGWQRQPGAESVQGVLEHTLTTSLRHKIAVTGAGRTDAGVHAEQLVAHFDCPQLGDIPVAVHKLNAFLPQDIAVNAIRPVKEGAHARFDATERAYEYRTHLKKDPFLANFSHKLFKKPDLAAMQLASKILTEHQDFKCFSRSNTDVRTYTCDIRSAHWGAAGGTLVFYIAANRFLRNMVRAIVGTLLGVGFGKITIDQFYGILESRDRSRAGASAPAHGLYLTRVSYRDTLFL
ncbi:MAG: tRNA pseudouridine(38-40) synthase TruA [Marinirhabdus sp.]